MENTNRKEVDGLMNEYKFELYKWNELMDKRDFWIMVMWVALMGIFGGLLFKFLGYESLYFGFWLTGIAFWFVAITFTLYYQYKTGKVIKKLDRIRDKMEKAMKEEMELMKKKSEEVNNIEKNKKFGTLVELTRKQKGDRHHFSKIPVGTRAVIIKEVDLPAYDALAVFEGFKQSVVTKDDRVEDLHTGYLERGSYKIIEQKSEEVNEDK